MNDTADTSRIDSGSPASLRHWAEKLDATPEQISEAVDAVGNLAADVEMHLKGSHATTNADREQLAERLEDNMAGDVTAKATPRQVKPG